WLDPSAPPGSAGFSLRSYPGTMLHAPILTPRLRLELFDESTWRRLADARPGWPAHLRYAVSDPHVLPSARYARGRLGQLTANPARHPWMARAIVREADAVMIGHINFHHPPPDPDRSEEHTSELQSRENLVC